MTDNAESPYSVTEWRGRERKGGLKLLCLLMDQFKASTGWLNSFKKRHNIVWNRVCGESKDVDESVVSINQNCWN
jgi:hypothetical protein